MLNRLNHLWEKLELKYYKLVQKKQTLVLNQIGDQKRIIYKSSIPYKKITLLILFALILTLSFQQLYSHLIPLRPIIKSKPVPHAIEFMGALITEKNAFALINKQTMEVGDELYGLKILAIQENKLDLQGPDGVISLNMGSTYRV